ncbi:glutamate receptor ionotropic, delta-2-like [Parasteatoda tepidariorum]|uniref:glutamate receptor ionotropic, delta-2-like n=1 Tax=Parasteatoda tepidariorum TaxID=114398 RepID=UPI0039BD1E93
MMPTKICPFIRRNLTVAVKPIKFFYEIESVNKLKGIGGEFFDLISYYANFKYSLVVPLDGQFGHLDKGGNWTGLVGMVHRNEADMALSVTMTEERMTAVDFSIPYTVQDISFFIKRPLRLPNVMNFLQPFSFNVWMCLLSAIFITPAVFYALFNTKHSYFSILFQVFGSVLKQSTHFKTSALKGKSFLMLWYAFTLILSWSYSATFVTNLALPPEVISLRNFVELSNAVRNKGYRCYVEKGSSIPDALLSSQHEDLRYLGKAISKNKWYFEVENLVNSEENLDKIAISDTHVRLDLLSRQLNTKVIFSKDVLMSWKLAIALSKNLHYKNCLDFIVSRISGAGLLSKFKRDATLKIELSKTQLPKVTKCLHTITLTDMYYMLIFLVVGYVSAGFALLGEVAFYRYPNFFQSKIFFKRALNNVRK